MYIYKQCHQNK